MSKEKLKIFVPFSGDKELITRWENWLLNRHTKYDKRGTIGDHTYHIEVVSAQDAFWIGCNAIALANKLFDGPLTTTLQS